MTPDQRDLLQALAFLYLRHGQNRRALTLILLAARDAPDDVGIMRTLAYAFIANDAPNEALEVIERLETLDFAGNADQMRRLLKARALLRAGRRVEAKAVFRQFVEARKAGHAPIAELGAAGALSASPGVGAGAP
jgi:type III secretion protein Y